MAQLEEIRKKLAALNETQASIETVSQWLVFHRRVAETAVQVWNEEIDKANGDGGRRLVLIYLANDVLQNSRRKGPEYQAAFAKNIPDILPKIYSEMDSSIQAKVYRVVEIWKERAVFSAEFMDSLLEKLPKPQVVARSSAGAPSKSSSSTAQQQQQQQLVQPKISTEKIDQIRNLWIYVHENAGVPSQRDNLIQARTDLIAKLKAELALQESLLLLDKTPLVNLMPLSSGAGPVMMNQQQFPASSSSLNDPRKRQRTADTGSNMPAAGIDLNILNQLIPPMSVVAPSQPTTTQSQAYLDTANLFNMLQKPPTAP